MPRVDPRQNYLRDLRMIPNYPYSFFLEYYNTARLFLMNPERGREYSEVEEIQRLKERFVNQFRTELGVPDLAWILKTMDNAAVKGHKYIKVKTRHTRRRFLSRDLDIQLNKLRSEIFELVIIRAKEIRITDPALAV